MHILDYDDFNIYTVTELDVKNFIDSLIIEGYEFSEEIYTMCIEHFGENVRIFLNEMFFYED